MDKQNRILQICALNAGGIETFVMNIYRELRKENIIFDFINYFDSNIEQFHEKEVMEYGSRIYKTGSMNYKNILYKHIHKDICLYKFLKKNKYSVVHIHASDNISLEDAFIAKIAGVKKIIVHSHNSSVNKNEKLYRFKNIFQRFTKIFWRYTATNYFACSKLAAEWMFDKKLNNLNKVEIINNAIDAEQYKFDQYIRKDIRKELNLENKFVIGHIGRFSYQKNHEFLIDIFYEFNKINKNSVLLLIGEGELKTKIEEKVRSLNIEDSVIFYGLSKRCSKLMQAMDVFLLPSHFEGLPLVGIEAQAASLKVIVSNNVSKQMKITDNVEYVPLENGSKMWAKIINKYCQGYKREYMLQEIEKSGYGILGVSKQIKKYYVNA
ncbi:glycosyltransferase family 1 protein [Clostridium nitritogenes]|uniref:Glycosyltransferase family 1 protein n=1 Tax=Clostridium nitritogenes TaxID=83340 RepID=A0ABP3WRQ5_9CLOT